MRKLSMLCNVRMLYHRTTHTIMEFISLLGKLLNFSVQVLEGQAEVE